MRATADTARRAARRKPAGEDATHHRRAARALASENWGIALPRWRFGLCSLLALVLLAVSTHASNDELPDPIPLRRIVVPVDRIPAELKRVEEGVLTRIPRKEFDDLVRSAARAVKEGRQPPRLIEAKYQATLTDAPALLGTAQWKILNPSAKPALLRLQSDKQAFNLAIARPRFDNREALIGDFPDPVSPKERTLALLVDQPGQQTVTFDWSARVESRPDGLQVDLRLPLAPAGLLELDLPADRSATTPDSSLISGPHPAEKPDRRLWRVAIGGKTKLPLSIRKSEAGKRLLLLARQRTIQKLTPDGLDSVTTFSVEALHRDVSEFVLEVDPLLRPIEVSAPGLQRWKFEPKQGVLVQLERPVREATVSIRCLAPLFSEQTGKPGEARSWVSPSVRLAGAVPRGEVLELRIHPELRMDSWSAGDFLLDDSSSLTDPDSRVALRRLTLRGGSIAPASESKREPRRPTARLSAGAVDYRVNRLVWWRLGADGMEMSAQLDYQVRQGVLFQLPIRLPLGWEVESVDLTPADPLRSWYVRQDKTGPLLVVDLRKPLRASDLVGSATLHLRVRPRVAQPLAGRDLPFPDLTPVGASFVEGGLALDHDEQLFAATVRTSALPAEPPARGPWAGSVPEHFYPYAGQPIAGTVRLVSRPSRLLARAVTEVHLGSGRAVTTTRLHLEGESGHTTAIDVYLAPGEGASDWQADRAGPRVRHVERLHHRDIASGLALLSARCPLSVALAHSARPVGSFWRLHLDRPLPPGRRTILSASTVLDATKDAVPLPVVLGTSRFDGEVTLFLSGGEPVALSAQGLRDGPLPRHATTAWRSLRYGDLSARLSVRSRPGRSAESSIDRAKLLTSLTGDELVHLFRFRLSRWNQRAVPVRLPEGARLAAAAVNGHWLARAEIEDGTVELPVPSGEAAHFEVLYTMPAQKGLFGSRLHADAPALPLPIDLERHWRLPPDVSPLWEGRMRLIPGDGLAPEMPTPWQRLTGLFRLGPRLTLPEMTMGSPLSRPQALADATAALRARHAGTPMALGDAVEEMASVYLKDAHPLLIDRVGLHRGKIDRTTRLTFAPSGAENPSAVWEEVGLMLVPGSAGVLLTTSAQWQRWQREGDAWPASVEAALADAARLGRDPSGRFVTALEWRTGEAPPDASALLASVAHEGWNTWVPIAGQASESLAVVRLPVSSGTGVLLGLALLALLFAIRGGRRVGYLFVWLALSGIALAWLPGSLAGLAWWPLLFALGASLTAFLVWVSQSRPRALRAAGGTVAAVLAVVLSSWSDPAQAQKTTPDLVFLLPAPSADKQAVLVAPAVLERLRGLAASSLAPTTGVALLDGQYEGKLVKGRPKFDATLHVSCLGEGPTTVEVPLDGAQLTGEVLVDGARALPVALAAPKSGFSLILRARGRHKIQFEFEAALAGSGETAGVRSVRFSVPRLVQSRLVFHADAGITHLQVPVRHGGQKVVSEGKGTRLEVDLGALAAPVQMRWYQEGKASKPAKLVYREAYLWELSPEWSTLQAYVRYDIAEGAVTSLKIDLPEGMDVRSVLARRPAGAVADAAVRVTDWSVSDGASRTLRVDLPSPVSGEVELTLELIPTGPWQGLASLSLPRPQGQPADQSAGYLAYRLQGVEGGRVHQLGLKGIRPAEFAPFWASRPQADTPTYAGLFRRNQSPELRLALVPRTPRVRIDQDVSLRIGSRQARWQSVVEIRSPEKNLLLLEWDLAAPGLTITDVTGPGVYRWTRTGNRLSVWLEPGPDHAKLILSGIVTLELPAAKKPDPPRLELPCLRPLRVESATTRFTLAGETGLALQMQKVRNLKPRGPVDSSPLVYLATNTDHAASILVRPGRASRATIRTEIGRRDKDIGLTGTIELQPVGGQRSFTIRLGDWPGQAWLERSAGFAVRQESYRRASGRREWNWTIELPPGPPQPIRAVVRGRLPADEAGEGFAVPDVSVSGVVSDRVVAIETMSAEASSGLVELPDAGGIRSWRIREANWSLRVRPLRTGSGVRIVLGEHRATLDDGGRWVHKMDFLLWQEGPETLSAMWAGPVELLSASVDDSPLSLTRVEQGRLPISLSEPGGARRVRLCWQYPPGREPLARPDLTAPRLNGAIPGPTLWTVEVPPGWEANGSAGANRRAIVELYRTRAQLDLARAGSNRSAAALASADRSLRLARVALDCGGTGTAPDGKRLTEWRARLLIEYEALRGETPIAMATNEVRDSRRLTGTLTGWVGEKDDRVPTVRLVPGNQKQTSAALAFTGQWVMVLLSCVAIAASAPLSRLARWLWPEAALLLGLLGWHAAGATPGVLFLLVLWIVGRLLLIGQVVRRRRA